MPEPATVYMAAEHAFETTGYQAQISYLPASGTFRLHVATAGVLVWSVPALRADGCRGRFGGYPMMDENWSGATGRLSQLPLVENPGEAVVANTTGGQPATRSAR